MDDLIILKEHNIIIIPKNIVYIGPHYHPDRAEEGLGLIVMENGLALGIFKNKLKILLLFCDMNLSQEERLNAHMFDFFNFVFCKTSLFTRGQKK